MKLHPLVCLSGGLLLAASQVLAQIKTPTEASLDQNPFGKGSFFIGPWSKLNYSQFNTTEAGSTVSNNNQFGFGAYPMYFPVNNLAVGLDLGAHYKDSKSPGDNDNKDTRWTVGPDLLYGFHFTPTFNLYARAGVSFGQENTKSISGGDVTSYNYNLFDYNFSVGAPFHLCSDGHLYFTPYISYDVFSSSYTGQKTVDGKFLIGFKMETYILPEDRGCSTVHQATTNMYRQGYSYLDFSTAGGFSLATDKTTYSYGGTGSNENITNWSFCGGYNYYLINYLSGGIRAGIGDESDNFGSGDGNTSKFKWEVGPFVDFHIPVDNWANKIYLFGEYKWESVISKAGTGSIRETTTQMRTSFNAGLGYDFFFSTHMSVGPEFGYRMNNYKTTGSTIQTKDDGFLADFGIKYYWR